MMQAVEIARASLPTYQTGIEGVVTDSEGAAIHEARVILHWDSSGSTVGLQDNIGLKNDLTVQTDERGKFTAAVPPGFYDLFVSARGFSPVCLKARNKPGTVARYKVKLQASPIITKEMGDTF